MLEILGMSDAAENVYRAMLGRSELGAAELAEHLGWSGDKVKDALEELTRLSLIRHSGQQAGGLLLVNPEFSLASLLARQEVELARRQQELASGRLAISELIAEHARSIQDKRRLEVEELPGVDLVRVRLEELTHSCTSDLMELITGGGQSAANRQASTPLDQQVLERGVHMRSVYLQSVVNHPETVAYLAWLAGLGGRVRLAPALPLRMIIFDHRTAIVPSKPEDTASGALLLRGAGLVSALCALFEYIWEDATPFGATPQGNSTGLTSQERAVLSLLAQGRTDEVVARKLGISVRTSRRITAELMTALGARSRFQAGVIAGERGWLQGLQDAPERD
ncbi:DNA-binding CsgD family transcriptional regulator [Micromonospora luteifusca]|uniref:DNA-binding CsgD family transcriptional regulator n=1 Tax=Micromonospora luteifusca TaxID=709860 RepID=A0ABS2LYL7_9ACTN|nr:helix-turn-helix transcriptional regulator [Micromonospora luteifusca]MBM7493300.1 DNA-binding CsgD family transcriptional regulator [Micromonospora luteifusca]